MNLTKHARKRIRQRGLSRIPLDIILAHGAKKHAPGGATKVFFGNKEYQKIVGELKQAIQLMDKLKGTNVIIQGNDVITVYKA